jgi:hypothetical protein
MKAYYFITALLFLALGMPGALKADSTYYLAAQNVNGEIISGTITTDGNMGSLNHIDLESFSFGLTNVSTGTGGAGATGREMGKSPDINDMGSGLTATSAGLFFNFDDTQPSTLIFQNALDGFEWCIFTDEGCDPPGSGELLSFGGSSGTVTGLSGNVMIASVTPAPEPGTWGFALIGIAGIAFVMRKRLLPGVRAAS